MTSRTITAAVALLLVIGLGVFGFASAQQPARQSSDPMLQELRLLRQTVEGDLMLQAQIQLAATRASSSQMRVSSLEIELSSLRSQIAEVAAQLTQADGIVKRMEALVPPGTPINQTMPIGEQYYLTKAQLETGQQRQAQLQARESQIVAVMAAEQARLDAANRRLDDLERAIAPRR